jgi:hypothetical protein
MGDLICPPNQTNEIRGRKVSRREKKLANDAPAKSKPEQFIKEQDETEKLTEKLRSRDLKKPEWVTIRCALAWRGYYPF